MPMVKWLISELSRRVHVSCVIVRLDRYLHLYYQRKISQIPKFKTVSVVSAEQQSLVWRKNKPYNRVIMSLFNLLFIALKVKNFDLTIASPDSKHRLVAIRS